MNSKRQAVLSIFLSRGLYFGVGISYILAHGINFTIINFSKIALNRLRA